MDEMHHKAHMAHLREKTERDRSFGDLAGLGHSPAAAPDGCEHSFSAPTSPLKVAWGRRNLGPADSLPGTPERVPSHHTDDLDSLGLAGDVIVSSLQPTAPPPPPLERAGSSELDFPLGGGSSRGGTPDPLGGSYESLGVSATWRSVDDMSKLAQGIESGGPTGSSAPCSQASSPPRRSRATSEEK